MKTTHKLALVFAGLLAGTSFAQTAPMTTVYPTTTSPSIQDSPGTLGHSYLDLNYSWVDFDENNASPRGFIAGLSANTPIARGLDVGLGYNYFRENGHRDPFNNSSFDARSHQVSTNATWFVPNAGFKPFLTGALGYKWSNGDLQSLRTFDDTWVWGASAGAEIPLGSVALTPRVAYSDDFHGGRRNASWHYGAQAHHWFSERVGGYLDAAYHNPHEQVVPEYWTYTAGVRLRF